MRFYSILKWICMLHYKSFIFGLRYIIYISVCCCYFLLFTTTSSSYPVLSTSSGNVQIWRRIKILSLITLEFNHSGILIYLHYFSLFECQNIHFVFLFLLLRPRDSETQVKKLFFSEEFQVVRLSSRNFHFILLVFFI